MTPLDLIRAKDGSMSLTKLAAATAHGLMAAGFGLVTWQKGFISELWLIYGGYALGHAVLDKAGAQVADFKNKKLDVEGAPP
jgi:hypothetical protein